MKLISSHEAVTFLSQAAPRPWVQRLLRWMAFDEGLPAYSRKGKVQPFTSIFSMTVHLVQKVGKTGGPELDEAIRKEFPPETAANLIGRDPHDRFYDEPFVWDEHDEPKQLDIGFFLYASEIDWEAGTLKADLLPGSGELSEVFFPERHAGATWRAGLHHTRTIQGVVAEPWARARDDDADKLWHRCLASAG